MGISAFPEDFVVPQGLLLISKALYVDVTDWARTTGNLRYYHRHDSGGHFAAVEKPDVLVADIREFVKIVKREAKL